MANNVFFHSEGVLHFVSSRIKFHLLSCSQILTEFIVLELEALLVSTCHIV